MRLREGEKRKTIAKEYGVHPNTLRRYLGSGEDWLSGVFKIFSEFLNLQIVGKMAVLLTIINVIANKTPIFEYQIVRKPQKTAIKRLF